MSVPVDSAPAPEQWTPCDYTATLYASLPLTRPKSIRLLNIQPAAPSEPIHCTIEVVDLEDALDYEALSYVWGPSHPRKHVTCNGVSIEVTPNLALALTRLRYPGDEKIYDIERVAGRDDKAGVRRIWVDALCINQGDLVERSNQVHFMKEIYDAAADVVVWMGEEDTVHAADVFALIKRIAVVARNEPEYDPERPFNMGCNDKYPVREDLPSPDDQIWGQLNFFLQHEWFQRVWVLQEVARDDARMILGPHEVSYRDFQQFTIWVMQKHYFNFNSTGLQFVTLSRTFVFTIGKRGVSLARMLTGTTAMAASDPRDQIYALLGFYSMFLKGIGREDNPIKVDYTKPIKEVYQECLRHCLTLPMDSHEANASLNVMLRNQGLCFDNGDWITPPDPAEDREFPSWIPRWDLLSMLETTFTDLQDEEFPPWNASSGLPPQIGNTANPNVLSLRGFQVSEIACTHRIRDDNVKELTLMVLNNPGMAARYSNDHLLRDALAKTLTAGYAKNDGSAQLYGEEDLESLWTNSKAPPRQLFTKHIHDSNFFTTSDGYIGIGSIHMKVGDIICVLYGGRTLLILRPTRDERDMYYLMGESYIHGLMYGEAFKMLKAGEAQGRWFDLC